jgi:ankyrin repeat protein
MFHDKRKSDFYKFIDSCSYSVGFSIDNIKKILECNRNVINDINEWEETALHYVCYDYDEFDTVDHFYKTIELLFSYNANSNVAQMDGITPLNTILKCCCDIDIVKLFIDNGADVNFHSPIITALENSCSFDIIKLLIDSGANCLVKNDDGMNLIDIYINNYIEGCEDDIDVLSKFKLLIDTGININERNCLGVYTTFTDALEFYNDNIEIIKLFIDSGADLSLTYDNKSILDLCKEYQCNTEIIELIKSKIS